VKAISNRRTETKYFDQGEENVQLYHYIGYSQHQLSQLQILKGVCSGFSIHGQISRSERVEPIVLENGFSREE
jgi:hypothetical protein